MARWVKSSGENVNVFRRVATPGVLNDINEGDLWADLSVAPPVLMKCTSLSPVTWVSVEGSGGGGGESNTASNLGSGVGVYKQKTGVNLELKSINAGSNKITITDDTSNNEIDIDVAQANLSLGSIGGSVSYSQIQNISDTDKLLGRVTSGAGVIEEITLTAAGRALIDDVDASAQRTTLGLGTLATQSGTVSGTNTGDNAVNTLYSGLAASKQDVITGLTSSAAELNILDGATLSTTELNYVVGVTSSIQTQLNGKASSLGVDDNYVTDAEKTKLSNLSGTNTGDQTSIVGLSGTKAQFDTACSDGNFLYVGDVSTPNVFGTIAVSGQSDVIADSSTDTLTLVAGSNITITTNATTDEITITGSGGGSGLTQPQVMAIASMKV